MGNHPGPHHKLNDLNYSEELFLLMIDPVTGRFFPVPDQTQRLIIAGSILIDASFFGLINDDFKELTFLRSSGSHHPVLHEAMMCFKYIKSPSSLSHALTIVASHTATLRTMIWDGLITRGILSRRKSGLNVQTMSRHRLDPEMPVIIGIHQKIRKIALSDEIPDVTIPPLFSLIVAGGLLKYIFRPGEIETARKRIDWLAGMEALGREIIMATRLLKKTDLEEGAASLFGIDHNAPKTFAGGMDAVLSSLSFIHKEAGIRRGSLVIKNLNQTGGFECPGCAWPNPEGSRSHFEFCENGAKNVSAEATLKQVTPDFFRRWSVQDLLLTSGYWLEQQGRLTEPMILDENATHYRPISWNQAFGVIARELKLLESPDQAVFYASGRTSVEAAFLYQLFARIYGTNNLPNSANLCHEPSGLALSDSLGYGKTSITPDDFHKADAIFILGHNPGSNHARMLKSLQEAVRNGCRIVAVNPMTEASLMGFADPQEASAYLGRSTPLAQLYLQPFINGDMALIRGIAKAILEKEELTGGVLDHDFIKSQTEGFEAYRTLVRQSSWDELVSVSGIKKSQMLEAAEIYCNARNVIASWCLGITHHMNAVETIREIVNLLLLRGNIGREGAGVLPIRGHSNIQGIRTAGVGESMPVSFFDSMDRYFGRAFKRDHGLSVVPAIKSMAAGKTRVLVSLGGNLASAVSDTAFTENAIRNCRLTVMISTKLNRSHLVTGRIALILPCLSRSEAEVVQGSKQSLSIEDAMGRIGFSRGSLTPLSNETKSEISIVAGIAEAVLGNLPGIDWQRFSHDYQYIRSVISEAIPRLHELPARAIRQQGFYPDNPIRKRIFQTLSKKAFFSQYPLANVAASGGELMLMTIRSHDQFNTSVFGLNDRYRGIRNERRVLFMNREDMDERKIRPGHLIDIISYYDNRERRLEGYYAIAYPIRKGCVAAYFPEANALISINNTCGYSCYTPAYKSVKVKVVKC